MSPTRPSRGRRQATPSAVDTTPSMPFTPRFEYVGALRGWASTTRRRARASRSPSPAAPHVGTRFDDASSDREFIQRVVLVDLRQPLAHVRRGFTPEPQVLAFRLGLVHEDQGSPPRIRSRVDRDPRRSRRRRNQSCARATHAGALGARERRVARRDERRRRAGPLQRTGHLAGAGRSTRWRPTRWRHPRPPNSVNCSRRPFARTHRDRPRRGRGGLRGPRRRRNNWRVHGHGDERRQCHRLCDEGFDERGVQVDGPGTREKPSRCVASRQSRWARSRHVAASSTRATPGSSKRRTMSPKSRCWSIVWGAPTPWSSGGRSAVSTRSGTKAWEASATHGVEFGRGGAARHDDRHRRARDERTAEGEESRAAFVNTNVDLEFSATRAGQGERRGPRDRDRPPRREVPGESIRQRASPRTWPAPHSGSVRSVAMSLLGVQRRGSGPLLVWLHGFTQTKESAHQFRSILAGTNELLTLDLPGHGENAAYFGVTRRDRRTARRRLAP